jgi:Leucine-rich repeat (LRR) protein
MKTFFPILILLVFGNSFSQTHAFSDLEFQKFIQNTYPATLDANGNLIIAEAANVLGTMNCQNKNISNLDGIQYFTGLTGINCSGNKLATLPNLQAILNLKFLNADRNSLSSLNFLSNNTNLLTLSISQNNLVGLGDITALTDLKNLYAHHNAIVQASELSSFTQLIELNISHNKLTALPDLTGTQLETFNCSHNSIAQFPNFSSVNLDSIICSYNKLTSFPSLSGNASLRYIDCSHNLIESYPVLANLPSLATFIASYNKLRDMLAYPGLNALKMLDLSHNQLTELPYLGYMSLQELDVSYNSIETPLDYDGLLSIQFVNFSHNNLKSLGPQPNFQIHQDYSYNYLTFQYIRSQDLAPGNSILFPQKQLPIESVLELKENEPYTLDLNIDNSVGSNTFHWYRNGAFWKSTTTSAVELMNFNGTLFMVIRNSAYPNDSIRTTIAKVYTNACATENCDEFVLSPNGDGLGDSYFINHYGKIEIINREGKVVKTGSEPFYWDGDDKGTGYFLLYVDGKKIAAITLIR